MAGEASEVEPGTEEVDELAGEELFEIPDDLKDEPDYGAPAPAKGTEPATGGQPAADAGATQQPAKEPEGAPAPAPGQPPAPAPAGTAAEPAKGADGAPAPAAAVDEEDEPELEFSFTANKQPITIKGSRLTKDSLIIPRQHAAEVQRLLSRGVTYQTTFRQRLEQSEREKLEAKNEVQEDVVRARATLDFFGTLLDKGAEAVQDWLDDFEKNRTRLEADQTLAVAKALREHKPVSDEDVKVPGFEEEIQEFTSQVDREELQNTLVTDLTAFVPHALRELGLKGLTGPEIKSIIDEVSDPDEIERYFGIAGEDMPEFGVQKGGLVRKDQVLAKTLKRRAEQILGARRNGAELETAKQKNNRPAAAPIPPTTTGTGGAAGTKVKKPLPKTREELDAWMDDDDD